MQKQKVEHGAFWELQSSSLARRKVKTVEGEGWRKMGQDTYFENKEMGGQRVYITFL